MATLEPEEGTVTVQEAERPLSVVTMISQLPGPTAVTIPDVPLPENTATFLSVVAQVSVGSASDGVTLAYIIDLSNPLKLMLAGFKLIAVAALSSTYTR